MSTNQAQRQAENPPGTNSTPAGGQQQKRQAVDSKGILADLEQAAKQKPVKQVESFQQKKNRILERCGCL